MSRSIRQPSPVAPGFSYDPRTRRYHSADGRIVSGQAIRDATERQIEATAQRARALATDLREGRINLAQWQLGMEATIKRLHLSTATVARGGFAQLNQSDLGWIGSRVRTQYEFLRNFVREIESGKQPLDGRFLTRVDMYISASRGSQREMERRVERIAGAVQERRILGIADHCPTCLSEAAKGWRPLGELKPWGQSECLVNCKCHWETRTEAA